MTSLTEGQHTGEFIVDEPSPKISREVVTVTVPTATKLEPGFVLAKLSATSKYVPYDNAGSDGSETAKGVLYGELDNSAGEAPVDFTGVALTRMAAVRKSDLKWVDGMDAPGKAAAYTDLAAAHLIAVED